MESIYSLVAPFVLFIFWILAFIKLFSQEGGLLHFFKHFSIASLVCGGLFYALIINADKDLEAIGYIFIFSPILFFVYFIWSIIFFFNSLSYGKTKNETNDGILDDNFKN